MTKSGIFHAYLSIRRVAAVFLWLIAQGVFTGASALPNAGFIVGESQLTQKGLYRITVEKAPTPIPTNRFQTWMVTVTTADNKPLSTTMLTVSAGMPQHGHGMSTEPQVSRVEPGKFLIEGLKFHMPGYWEVKLAVTADGRTDELMFALDLQ